MVSPPFLQVEWSAVPGANAFLEALRPYTSIAPPVVVSEDFANIGSLAREEQERRLRELDQRGQTIAAVYLARKLYGTLTSLRRRISSADFAPFSRRPITRPRLPAANAGKRTPAAIGFLDDKGFVSRQKLRAGSQLLLSALPQHFTITPAKCQRETVATPEGPRPKRCSLQPGQLRNPELS